MSPPARLQRVVCFSAGVVIARCAGLMELVILFKWSLLQQGEGRSNIQSCCVPLLLFEVFIDGTSGPLWMIAGGCWAVYGDVLGDAAAARVLLTSDCCAVLGQGHQPQPPGFLSPRGSPTTLFPTKVSRQKCVTSAGTGPCKATQC